MNSSVKREAKLTQLESERDKLLRDIGPLVEDGDAEDAIKKIEDAKYITDKLEAERSAIEKSEDEASATMLDDDGVMESVEQAGESAATTENNEWAKAKIDNLVAERDELIEALGAMVEKERSEALSESAMHVERAAKLSEELRNRSSELTGQIGIAKRMTDSLSVETAKLESIRLKEESKAEKATIGENSFDRMVINSIALGFETPSSISKMMNINKFVAQEKIKKLIVAGYVKDPSDPIVDLLTVLRMDSLIRLLEVFTTRKLTHAFILTDKGYDQVDAETFDKLMAKLEEQEHILERVVGWGLGTVVSIIKPIANYLVAVIGLIQLIVGVVREIPTILRMGLKMWVSG
ncbi:MAG: hypothetical protein MOIL_00544 [Candidatus Methanolliviera sp. GoM_oil]|nr:MAG: hypothetical protein MOIL_00544 [Candidatus Methanolliviera sp. GoM_oil]